MKLSRMIGIVVLVVAAGCSGDRGTPAASSTSTAPEGNYGCGKVTVDRWAAADTRNADAPILRLPQPPDWKHVNAADSDAALVLRNDSLGSQLSPSAVVTVTDATGTAQNPQAVIDAERENINTKFQPKGLAAFPGTVCGFQATTFVYRTAWGAAADRQVKTVVVAPAYDNKLFDVVISVQAGDSGDQAYLADAQTILTGMEIKAPTPH